MWYLRSIQSRFLCVNIKSTYIICSVHTHVLSSLYHIYFVARHSNCDLPKSILNIYIYYIFLNIRGKVLIFSEDEMKMLKVLKIILMQIFLRGSLGVFVHHYYHLERNKENKPQKLVFVSSIHRRICFFEIVLLCLTYGHFK